MCTNFVPSVRQELEAMARGVVLPVTNWPEETYPGYVAPIFLLGSGGAPECRLARFGLVPRWSKDARQANDIARKTYNARSETVAEKPSYKAPWQQRQWAFVPMQSYFDPCWEEAHLHGGKPVRWRMAVKGKRPFGALGLWDVWTNPQGGEAVLSFTLLTVNADGHAVMGRMHRPEDEKRMPVLLESGQFANWLEASSGSASEWIRTFPAEDMVAQAAPRGIQVPQTLPLF